MRIDVSRYIVDEMTAVMTDDLGLTRRAAALAAIRALRRGSLVEPVASRHTVPRDPADSEILRTALQAGADYLVTNDRHLLALTRMKVSGLFQWLTTAGFLRSTDCSSRYTPALHRAART